MLLIIEKLGVTVETKRIEMGGKLTVKTVCMLGSSDDTQAPAWWRSFGPSTRKGTRTAV